MTTSNHKLIDLFCGAGGMSLGFVDNRYSGQFRSILAIDNDYAAVDTYNENFDPHGRHVNIEDWLAENEVPSADIVIGGPPCQGFSLLNKDRVGDVRRALWEPFMDFVEKSGASMFVMENVPGLLKSPEFGNIEIRSKSLGFKLLNPTILNCADYGVPQTRKRIIIVGIKEEDFELKNLPHFPPPPTHAHSDQTGFLRQWKTVREAIGNLPEPEGVEVRANLPGPNNLHFGRNPTDKSKERYRAVPAGGNRFDLQENRPDITPECWKRKTSGGTDLFGRLWWDRPSVTIRTEFYKPEKGRYLHPLQHRPITHREAARLMSFPDDFVFKGTKIEIAKQIGNAVPPVFAGQIALYVNNLLAQRISTKKKAA